MKLYKVYMVTMVQADNIGDAIHTACNYAEIEENDCSANEIDSMDNVPENWHADCIPFAEPSVDDATIEDILKAP